MWPSCWWLAPPASSSPLTVLSSQSGSHQSSPSSAPSSSSSSSQTCSKLASPTPGLSRGQRMPKQKTLRGRSSSQMGPAKPIDLLLEPKKSRWDEKKSFRVSLKTSRSAKSCLTFSPELAKSCFPESPPPAILNFLWPPQNRITEVEVFCAVPDYLMKQRANINLVPLSILEYLPLSQFPLNPEGSTLIESLVNLILLTS